MRVPTVALGTTYRLYLFRLLAFGLQDGDTRQDDTNEFRLAVTAGFVEDPLEVRFERIKADAQIHGGIFHLQPLYHEAGQPCLG